MLTLGTICAQMNEQWWIELLMLISNTWNLLTKGKNGVIGII